MNTYFYSLFHISPILRFNSIRHFVAADRIATDGIIRLRIAPAATNTLTSSSGRDSAYGSNPSGTTSDSTCLEAPYTTILSPTDASSACSMYISINLTELSVIHIMYPSCIQNPSCHIYQESYDV